MRERPLVSGVRAPAHTRGPATQELSDGQSAVCDWIAVLLDVSPRDEALHAPLVLTYKSLYYLKYLGASAGALFQVASVYQTAAACACMILPSAETYAYAVHQTPFASTVAQLYA